MLWRRKWQPTPVFLPGNPMDRRRKSLAGYCPWGHKSQTQIRHNPPPPPHNAYSLPRPFLDTSGMQSFRSLRGTHQYFPYSGENGGAGRMPGQRLSCKRQNEESGCQPCGSSICFLNHLALLPRGTDHVSVPEILSSQNERDLQGT